MKKQYDVVIIGAGVVGSAIARELSRYKLSIAVLEKNLDVCNETSGRNSAVVHGGFANPTGSLKAKCCVEGNKIMDQLAEELLAEQDKTLQEIYFPETLVEENADAQSSEPAAEGGAENTEGSEPETVSPESGQEDSK